MQYNHKDNITFFVKDPTDRRIEIATIAGFGVFGLLFYYIAYFLLGPARSLSLSGIPEIALILVAISIATASMFVLFWMFLILGFIRYTAITITKNGIDVEKISKKQKLFGHTIHLSTKNVRTCEATVGVTRRAALIPTVWIALHITDTTGSVYTYLMGEKTYIAIAEACLFQNFSFWRTQEDVLTSFHRAVGMGKFMIRLGTAAIFFVVLFGFGLPLVLLIFFK